MWKPDIVLNRDCIAVIQRGLYNRTIGPWHKNRNNDGPYEYCNAHEVIFVLVVYKRQQTTLPGKKWRHGRHRAMAWIPFCRWCGLTRCWLYLGLKPILQYL